jgi:hypothetical protein
MLWMGVFLRKLFRRTMPVTTPVSAVGMEVAFAVQRIAMDGGMEDAAHGSCGAGKVNPAPARGD